MSRTKKIVIFFGLSLFILLTVFITALMVGRYSISIKDFVGSISTNDSIYDTQRSVIINLRLPRTIIAGLTGIALSVSGLLYQETFQNKLVSPGLLGVSNGASVGAAIAILLGATNSLISFSAFVAGIITVILTVIIGRLFNKSSSISLILAGIVIGGFMSSIMSIIKYTADPDTTLSSITYWLMGSFADSTLEKAFVISIIVFICIAIVLSISWRINIVALGYEEAQTKGINYRFYRYLIISIATLLTAASVACAGAISWIGLIIPHIVRLISGRNTSRSIPLCITFGGVFMIVADILSRTFTGGEIPLSAITGAFGSIIFVILLVIKKREVFSHD
ncbi:MAG: iron ABC transporter permease [Bacilli bacterium]|nr:iron ABC transporter permease [Bacilli bacterium]